MTLYGRCPRQEHLRFLCPADGILRPAQFRAIGVNYNQCVKAIHMTFGDKKALAYLYRLTLETQRLEQLVKAVVELTKELLQWCRK